MMQILHLTLKKKWFDLILSKSKIFEYREDKEYWRKRFLNANIFKKFDVVRFRNGYNKNVPVMDVRFRGFSYYDSFSDSDAKCYNPSNGEILVGRFFVLKLGEIISVSNNYTV